MSEKKFEECSLEDATHVKMGGVIYKLGIRLNDDYDSKNRVAKHNSLYIEVCTEVFGWQLINSATFPILGIQPLKEIKPEPIEFEATFIKHDGKWYPSYSFSLDDSNYQNNKKARFKCVEILEDEE